MKKILILCLLFFNINFFVNKEKNENNIKTDIDINEKFSSDTLIITLKNKNSFSEKKYKSKDFSQIDCIELVDITENLFSQKFSKKSKISNNFKVNKDKFHRILKLKLRKSSKLNIIDSIRQLELRDDVLVATPNYINVLQNNTIITDDTFSNNQWAIEKISLNQAWEISTGTNDTIIGIMDSGIDYSHEDLIENVDTSLGIDITPTDAFDDNAHIDNTGHGTSVAGVIGAKGNNGFGIAGVNWNTTMISLKINNTINFSYYDNDIISILNYAAANNIKIINLSSVLAYSPSISLAIENYPGLIICCAGNQSRNIDTEAPSYPSSYLHSNIISVGSSTQEDTIAEHSNFGKISVDLFAPGTSIFTTKKNNLYYSSGGTSLATPFVTGVAALLLSKHPELTSSQIKELILNNVDENDNFRDKCVSGGRLNAYKALNALPHNYSDSYDNQNSATHISYCECGESKIENHTLTIVTYKLRKYLSCIYCSYEKDITDNPIIAPINGFSVDKKTENGSYLFSNGVKFICEKDLELFLSNKLVFKEDEITYIDI